MGTSTCSRAQSCLLSASTTEIPTAVPRKIKRMCVPGSSDPWCLFPLRLQLTTFIWSLGGTTLGKESEPRENFPERQKTWSGWTQTVPGSSAPRQKTMVAHVCFVTPCQLCPPAPPPHSPYSMRVAENSSRLPVPGFWVAEKGCSLCLGVFLTTWAHSFVL